MPDSDFGYARSLRGVVQRATTNLQDDNAADPNARFSESYLLAVACDALKMFAIAEPSLFGEAVKIKLEHAECGSYRLRDDQCEAFISVDSAIDDMGRSVPVQDGDYETIKKTSFFPSNCPHCRAGKMSTLVGLTFGRNPDDSREFRINPKVPPSTAITLCATCSNAGQYLDDPDKVFDCRFAALVPALHQWVMYMALSAETGAEAAATVHLNTFFDMLKLSGADLEQPFRGRVR